MSEDLLVVGMEVTLKENNLSETFCKSCYDEIIDVIHEDLGETIDKAIFKSSKFNKIQLCSICDGDINCVVNAPEICRSSNCGDYDECTGCENNGDDNK